VHGHRGARGIMPENTLAGFEYAIRAGADGIEMDVAVTRDDVPVVSHDPYLPEGRLIRGLKAAELRALAPAIPTLDEALALAPLGNFIFNIELKSFPDRPAYSPPPERFAAIALDAIRRARLESRTLIQSFDFRALRAFEALAPEIPRSALFHLWLGSFAELARRAHVRLVSSEFHLITKHKVRAARDAGVGVIAWTPNRPRQWRRLIAAGVEVIITDDPARLGAFLGDVGQS
jgi:glycerophosphoryl diester phosphodiesterase